MAKAPRFENKAQEIYWRKRESIQRSIRDLRSKGYEVSEEFNLPPLSQRRDITLEEAQKLKDITKQQLRESATKIEDTGELYDAPTNPDDYEMFHTDDEFEDLYDTDAQYSTDKETTNLLNLARLYEDIERFPTSKGASMLKDALDAAVEAYQNPEALGLAAKQMYEEGWVLGKTIDPSDPGQVRWYLNRMLEKMHAIIDSMQLEVVNEEAKKRFDYASSSAAQEELQNEVEVYESWKRSKRSRRRKKV